MTTHDEVREAAEKWALCEHEGVDSQYCLCHVKDEGSFIEGAEWKEQMMKLDSMPMRKYAEEIDSLKSQLQASKQENERLKEILEDMSQSGCLWKGIPFDGCPGCKAELALKALKGGGDI